jgi:hypothetical protein
VPWLEAVLVLGGFGLLAVVISWPTAIHFDTFITGGGNGGDPSGYVWDLWYNANHGLRFWGSTVQEVVSAPFGRVSPSSVNVTLLATVGPGWVVAKLFGPVAAYNVVALSGLALSASSMYLLVRWLGLGIAPAIWAGAAFMVFPYEQLRAVSHIPLTHLWCFPLLILAGIRWIEAPSLRRSFWLGAALGGCWIVNPYYGFMGIVMLVVIGAVGLLVLWRRAGFRAAVVPVAQVAGWVVLIVALPLLLLQRSGEGALDTTLARDPIELELYGARITDYLLPNADHSFFGGVVGASEWASIGGPGGERTVFVGYLTMLLALAAYVIAWRRRDLLTGRTRALLMLGAPLVVALVLFSLASPTRWFGLELTMPSQLIFDAVPYLRAFARFGAAVMAVLLVLAALGLRGILRGRTPLVSACLLSVAFIWSFAELPNGSPGGPLVSSAPPVLVNGRQAGEVPTWTWLRDRGGDEIVYEQPGTPNEATERYFMYGQLVHGQPILNGSLGTSSIASDFMRANPDPTWPGTAEHLASLGVGLVTINPWAYAILGAPAPDVHAPPPGYRRLVSFPDGSGVWAVTAPDTGAVAIARQGWWDPQYIEGRVWRWMHKKARVTLYAREAGRYRLSFDVRGGFGRRYVMTIRQGDEVVGRFTVRDQRNVVLPVDLEEGANDVWIESDLPPRQIGPEDLRIVTVQTTPWELAPAPAR